MRLAVCLLYVSLLLITTPFVSPAVCVLLAYASVRVFCVFVRDVHGNDCRDASASVMTALCVTPYHAIFLALVLLLLPTRCLWWANPQRVKPQGGERRAPEVCGNARAGFDDEGQQAHREAGKHAVVVKLRRPYRWWRMRACIEENKTWGGEACLGMSGRV